MGEERIDEPSDRSVGFHRVGFGERVLSLWLLYGKVSSLGSLEGTQEEEPVSAKEVLEDAIPFLAIALTSFVLLLRTSGS